jgi:hypothetical protein
MPRAIAPAELLQSIVPSGLCDDCIRDRVPIGARLRLPALISELKPPHFERATGECAGCNKLLVVTRAL